MKTFPMRYFFLAVVVTTLFQFCSKRNDSPSQYYGTWELRSSEGMLGYHEYPAGNGNVLRITKDSVYMYQDNSLVSSYKFEVVRDTLRGFGNDRVADRLSAAEFAGLAVFLERRGNTLTYYAGIPAADGGSSTYQLIK